MRAAAVCTLFLAALVQGDAPQGYLINEEDGHGYKLVYVAQTWQRAMKLCAEEGAKLAVPKSEQEFAYIQKIVRAMHYPSIIGAEFKLIAWVGVHSLNDYTVWENVDGENIDDTGFNRWAREKYISKNPQEPHCAGVDAINPGYRDWWCHRRQPYICEIQTSST
ncbi:hypothetical protein O3G_MSEX011500 [Manduca sexta]|uniref:C-type lectin domain-containing protein n=3 Tax=Manduca sexta TaxID=7130 RepID=A0A921ZKQ5_MANSE|nr:hypothetical protein O3G_MSEX011500 [Manduca sexta]